jgi:hypothetical protein
MVEHDPSRVSMNEAVGRVGAAIYGAQWIGALTERERWLIARYVDGSSKPQASSIVSGMVSYTVGGHRWAELPVDPALVAEVERALDRRDWHEVQCERAFDWLESHSFDVDAQSIAGEALAREMAKDFSSKGVGSVPTPFKAETARSVTEKSADKLAKEYIIAAQKRGERPTATGLVKYVRAAHPDRRGGREFLRRAIKKQLGEAFKGAGRPQKNSPE